MDELERTLPLVCECGNKDHGHIGAECSAECGGRMTLDHHTLVNWAYRKGWERAVWLYAVHKDGEMLVGVMQKPFKRAIEGGPDHTQRSVDLDPTGKNYPNRD